MQAVIERDVPLDDLNSWQVGGQAEFFCAPNTVDELREALIWAREHQLPATVLSGGTNVLISDRGVDGLVLCLHKLSGLEVREREGQLQLTALAGTSKSELLKTFLRYQLAPARFLAGLPGDVGGGVVMNAGIGEQITPREFHEITSWVEVLRPTQEEQEFEIVRLNSQDLHWSYRHCEGWRPGVVIRVGLLWPLDIVPDILVQVKAANRNRLSKQPLDLPSCGSVFINPLGHKAGQLIEAAGLKGFAIGGAQVSNKHANFIVNQGGATAADIHAVIGHVQTKVFKTSGVQLKTEVVYLGRWPNP